MAQYKTAQGRTIDMSVLIAKNEKTRAVGNMKVNARGDTIDSHGRVIEPVTTKVNNKYSQTVGNKSAHVVKPNASTREKIVTDVVKLDEMLPTEENFDSQDDLEIEKIKEQEIQESEKKKGKK